MKHCLLSLVALALLGRLSLTGALYVDQGSVYAQSGRVEVQGLQSGSPYVNQPQATGGRAGSGLLPLLLEGSGSGGGERIYININGLSSAGQEPPARTPAPATTVCPEYCHCSPDGSVACAG